MKFTKIPKQAIDDDYQAFHADDVLTINSSEGVLMRVELMAVVSDKFAEPAADILARLSALLEKEFPYLLHGDACAPMEKGVN